MAVIVKTARSPANYVTNFVVRRQIRSKRERAELVRVGLTPQVYEISEETMNAIPLLRAD